VPSDADVPPFDLIAPSRQTAPVVYASPHSGEHYPADLIAATRLPRHMLRKSEDSFVDRLFAAAPEHGSPLLRARWARVYLDVNREPYELDQGMFADPLPPHANTSSLRVAGGLGTIARVVSDGAEVYGGKLRFAEAEARVARLWRPYHAALADLVGRTQRAFGFSILIDCHSMPSVGGPMERDGGRARPDVVLGDRFGVACAPALADHVHGRLERLGYVVARNTPYAGGFTTHHYGQPARASHAVQIEINRALYMDERAIEPLPCFEEHARNFASLIAELSGLDLRPSLAAE
jgi:N-formylglutamate amidohydrolase